MESLGGRCQHQPFCSLPLCPWLLNQNYYGRVLKTSADLQTNACVTAATPVPRHIREALQNVHEEVSLRYYGCGLVIPERLENCWILDLGSGSGRDCYALSQLIGEKGHVTGIDMTEGQVEVAKKYLDYHMKKFGFRVPNVNFIHGYIEKLAEAGIQNESYNIVISNCVISLVPDKQQVLQEVYRVLKPGGELYFSDVYASLELPEEIKRHGVLWRECLGGALYWKDLTVLAQEIGFCTPRLVAASLITIQNKELERVIGDCHFVSATFRLFKLRQAEPTGRCQVVYNGGITGHEKELIFDATFTFKEGDSVEVDEETAAVLKNSRFAQDFLFRPVGESLPTSGGCSELGSKSSGVKFLYRPAVGRPRPPVDRLTAATCRLKERCNQGGRVQFIGGLPHGSVVLSSGKGIITDPFQLAERSDSMKSRCAPDVAGGCCGKKKSC